MTAPGAIGRPMASSIDYAGMPLAALVSVYEQAYVRAGFVLRERKTTIFGAGHGKQTLLRLAYVRRGMRSGNKGIASFKFWMDSAQTSVCAPCSLVVESFGPSIDYDHYDVGEIEAIRSAMDSAATKANVEIEAKLGKGPWTTSERERRMAAGVAYAGISPENLIAAIKQAYAEAGFTLVGEKATTGEATMDFEYVVAGEGKRDIAHVSETVAWQSKDDRALCAPCLFLDRSRPLLNLSNALDEIAFRRALSKVLFSARASIAERVGKHAVVTRSPE